MLEYDLSSRHKLVRMPEPEKGILKTKKDLLPAFKLQSGGVSVDSFMYDPGFHETFVRVEPEMSQSTLQIINESISTADNIANMAAHSRIIAMGLPSVQMLVGGSIIFSFEEECVAEITPSRGFKMNSDYFFGNMEVTARKLTAPVKKNEPFVLSIYRRQASLLLGKEQLITIDFEFAARSADELEARMHKLFKSGNYTPEDIRKIINVKLKVENLSSAEDDESGGDSASLGRPSADDGGSGVVA